MDTALKITYPEQLPITERVDEIAAAIRDHQVVVVAGETGSGKTTQLPKICLQLGRGEHGLIGHTQPRRLAARTVADRVADELGEQLGETIGYQVRFTDQVSDGTRVKLMTDGILLAELAKDRSLRRYDTLIIDEAHERSLNIDFILGYLATLLPRRPDFKLIITSATIDPHRFAHHFGADTPVIEVSGRTYPVEVRYRPPADDVDQPRAICDAVAELAAEGPGDILVFLSGEREIRDAADALTGAITRNRRLHGTEVLPLYARLSLAEQHKAFAPHTGRRIVLATNVAETSLTVPGIRYVVDPGTARISRYSARLKVQRLPIEPISQASATQRAGRCGRVADGICIRLYEEDDFTTRPTYTEPEILRTNLASVILQMAALKLGNVERFPFLDPPDRRQLTDGRRLLVELAAFDTDHRITALGRKLARLPVDPRLGRMILEADRNGCLREVLVITAALSIQDPRERPADAKEAADTQHARFVDPQSDFSAYLNLWHYLHEQQQARSGSQFRKMCRDEYLNYLRVREWQEVHQQLRRLARSLGGPLNREPADSQQVHTALLAGLLSHLGTKDVTSKDPRRRHEYIGARGARFAVAPGSALFKKSPQWVMVAELVETSRLWGRTAAGIQPEWVEPVAGHLIKREYSEPHWDAERGAVMAYEKVTLYGLPLVARRRINFARVDPALCRELFIRHALVEGEWQTHHQFVQDNQALLSRLEELERKARRRDILADDQVRYDFYDQRIPAEVVSAAHFDKWWKQTRRSQPELLHFTPELLLNPERADAATEADYPDHWRYGELSFPLTYQFEPGTAADGVTVTVPLPALAQAAGAGFDWQVPGLRHELLVALIRTLPKPVRRQLVPAPQVATELLAMVTPHQQPLAEALSQAARTLTGAVVASEAWSVDQVPDHLRMTIRVTDDAGAVLAEGKDLAALARRLAPAARASLTAAASHVERRGLTDWTIGELPRRVELSRAGHPVTAYPALVDAGDRVDVRVFPTEAEQARHMPAGTRRLLLRALPSPVGYVSDRLAPEAKLALLRNPHGGVRPLLDDCAGCAVDAIVTEHGGPAWDEAAFATLRDQVRGKLNRATLGVVTEILPIMNLANELSQRLATIGDGARADAILDMREQLSAWIRPGFVTDVGWQLLPDLNRWLQGIDRRLAKLGGNVERDRKSMTVIHRVQEEYRQLRSAPPPGVSDAALDTIGRMIEELRISLFAQQLGTRFPISEQRIYRTIDQLTG
ncbi:ATP-dependent RNA helicase HrpA [Natronosporangium hydrolyticum]|uniref:ATP-dependent RNA helicase HrpA n=1 Tax=Natronosporangium hydrolyticum TaxID=2811111 RepID=A0A895YF52_9ACTN|nr:ATP-dependent RNA helicase HrpA [Natronosporangium hydrolyticum]QSB16494.1 ATP-dependent RNA helicase HrpA [Natronosporangium hydrolyticum]